MPLVWVRRERLEIDILEELESFDWTQSKHVDDKFIACSPFRSDSHPSFLVNLENLPDKAIAGTWLDSGATTDYRKSGNFLTLLSLLREEDIEDTYSYLIEKYHFKPYSDLSLKLDLSIKKQFVPLEPLNWAHDALYLPSRGISPETIYEADVRLSDRGDRIALLWKDGNGNIQAIKYRYTSEKKFRYEKAGKRINECLYGLEYVYQTSPTTLVICEAEIDALSWRTRGYAAVAVGTSTISQQQLELLKRLPVTRIVLSGDNDEQGNKLNEMLYQNLASYFNILVVKFPTDTKDMNDYILKYQNIPEIKQYKRLGIVLNVLKR